MEGEVAIEQASLFLFYRLFKRFDSVDHSRPWNSLKAIVYSSI